MLDFKNFKENLELLLELPEEKSFLLAISGGVDSMVLLDFFCKMKLKFQVAHVNYHFRGEDSIQDQKLVEEFCKKHSIPFHLKAISDENKKQMKSLQKWAREIRYAFFSEILKQENLDCIVTAHHLNDELETFIINLSRGSGIKGLSGIPKNKNKIIRPLLPFSKEEIYIFAKENGIIFREDKSNEKTDYLRNKIRHQIIPEFSAIFPQFIDQFKESIHHLNAVNEFFQDEIEKSYQEIFISGNETEFSLDKEKLEKKPKIIKIEIIRKLGFTGNEIEKLMNAENGKFFRSNTFEIAVKKKELLCKRK